jgi:hypothetical protein
MQILSVCGILLFHGPILERFQPAIYSAAALWRKCTIAKNGFTKAIFRPQKQEKLSELESFSCINSCLLRCLKGQNLRIFIRRAEGV